MVDRRICRIYKCNLPTSKITSSLCVAHSLASGLRTYIRNKGGAYIKRSTKRCKYYENPLECQDMDSCIYQHSEWYITCPRAFNCDVYYKYIVTIYALQRSYTLRIRDLFLDILKYIEPCKYLHCIKIE